MQKAVGWLARVDTLRLWLSTGASSTPPFTSWLRLWAGRNFTLAAIGRGASHDAALLEVDVAVWRESARATGLVLATQGLMALIDVVLLDRHRVGVIHNTRDRSQRLTLEWYLPSGHYEPPGRVARPGNRWLRGTESEPSRATALCAWRGRAEEGFFAYTTRLYPGFRPYAKITPTGFTQSAEYHLQIV